MTEHTSERITGTCKNCGQPFHGVSYYTDRSARDPLVWTHDHNRSAYCIRGGPGNRAEDDKLWCNLATHHVAHGVGAHTAAHLLRHIESGFWPRGQAQTAISELVSEVRHDAFREAAEELRAAAVIAEAFGQTARAHEFRGAAAIVEKMAGGQP